jgi:hypothetical protein
MALAGALRLVNCHHHSRSSDGGIVTRDFGIHLATPRNAPKMTIEDVFDFISNRRK